MAQQIDGWALLARIASRRDQFSACEQTAALAASLLLRNQLVRGVSSETQFQALAETVGSQVMLEVIRDLAGYEAARVLRNMQPPDRPAERLSPDAARRRLSELAQQGGGDTPSVTLAEPVRTLRRHRSLGARRLRAASDLVSESQEA